MNKSSMRIFWILLLTAIWQAAVAEVRQLDRIVAIVDDDIVLQSELALRSAQIRDRLLAQQTPLPSPEVLRQKTLDQLVLESIQLQFADRVGLRISDTELNQTMQSVARQNGMNLEQFQVQLGNDGLTYDMVRDQVRREMIITRYQQRMVDSRVRVTQKEVEDFLQTAAAKGSSKTEYRISHILLTYPEGDEAAALATREKAERLAQEVLDGGSFAELAVTNSEASTALEGGDLGWRGTEELPTLFAPVVPKLSKGEVAAPIVTGSAVHLVSLADVRGGSSKIVEQSLTRHILIQLNELRDEYAARDLIKEIRDRAIAGESFAELARAYSDDAISGSAGGDLGWVNPGQMVQEFEAVMSQAPVNEISEPFRSQFGWHILEVLDRRKQDIGDQVQASQARQIIHRRKYEEELQNWLGEIRDEAYVELKI